MSDLILVERRRAARFDRWSFARSLACGLAVAFAMGTAASAQTFPLTLELQTGQLDDFGVVRVEADADGALVFDVEMEVERVGPNASVRRLFFNLLPETSGLWVESLDEDQDVRLVARPSRRTIARSGTRFDWRIDVHAPKGRTRPGRGRPSALPRVRFRVFADGPLAVDDLLPVSLTRQGEAVQMVVDMKQGRTPEGDRVRWVGGAYEPGEEEPPILR